MIATAELDRAITTAAARLAARRRDDGLWADFKTEAGWSDEWVTGFAAYALAQTGMADDHAGATLEALVARQRKNGGWGYNRRIPADADSTGWVLMALSTIPGGTPSTVTRGLRFLRAHQDPATGGFCTYGVGDGIDRVIGAPRETVIEGWLRPQPCVTGLVLHSVLLQGLSRDSPTVRAAAAYLLRQRSAEGAWPSYWWKGSAYSTYLALRALWAARHIRAADARAAAVRCAAEQRPDGGWNDTGGPYSEVFPTAFSLLVLLLFPDSSTLPAAGRGAQWLVEKQEADGTWPIAPILRIPGPIATRPVKMSDDAWRVMQRGTGVAVADPDSIYTSAAAVWALGVYRRVTGGSPA